MTGGDWLLTVVMALLAAAAAGVYWRSVTLGRNPLVLLGAITAALLAAFNIAGVALPQPVGVQASHTDTVLLVAVIVVLTNVPLLAYYVRRGDARLVACGLFAGAIVYPFLAEPAGDIYIAVTYPGNLDHAATVFGRAIPWHVVLIYAAGIPVVMTAGYRLARHRGARGLLLLAAATTVLEVPFELISAHYGWMHYFGNHALVGGVPIYCFVQNGGFVAVTVAALAWLEPLRGWRWALVPFVHPAALVALTLVGTFPAYLAIAFHAGPAVGWLAGILATLLNLGIVVACAFSPAVARLREGAETAPSGRLAPAIAVA